MLTDRLAAFLEHYPELALYLTVALGYLIGAVKFRGFGFGPVTGSLIAGIAISQFAKVEIAEVARSIFFLLFLFGIVYSVGPQFVGAMRRQGATTALLGVVMPITGLLTAFLMARLLGFDAGLAAGLVSGGLTESTVIGTASDAIRHLPATPEARDEELRGVYLRQLERLGPHGRQSIPLVPELRLERGDIVSLVGPEAVLNRLAARLGAAIRPTDTTDYVVLGLGIFLGGLFGAMVIIPVGDMHIALSTSVGTLLAGLVVGHLHGSRPTFGRIPDAAVSMMTSFGLAAFVAMIGLRAGPVFFEALQRDGLAIFGAGVVVTMTPLLVGLFVGRYVFKINPIVLLGALAGAQTMTAGLAAVQQRSDSPIAVIGYTAAAPFGHILLTISGTVIVWLMA